MTLRIEMAEPGGEPAACACSENTIPAAADETTRVVAAYLRAELGPRARGKDTSSL